MEYYIDTNIIIHYFDEVDLKNKPASVREQKEIEIAKAKEKLDPILTDDDSVLFINRLVYVETLRNIKTKKDFDYLKSVLDSFTVLDIYPNIYDNAIDFSRYCQTKGITIKGGCAAIDFIHFATAKYYNLELLANDKDMEKLENAWTNYQQTLN